MHFVLFTNLLLFTSLPKANLPTSFPAFHCLGLFYYLPTISLLINRYNMFLQKGHCLLNIYIERVVQQQVASAFDFLCVFVFVFCLFFFFLSEKNLWFTDSLQH